MRSATRVRMVAVIAVVALCGYPAMARQAERQAAPTASAPASGITVFEDVNYGGRRLTFVADQTSLRNTVLNDRISSLAIAPGEVWEVCEAPNFTGNCQTFADVEPDLLRLGWNDKISSLRRIRRPSVPQVRRLELFAGTNYTGQRVVLTEEVRDLRSVNFNDRAMSARIAPGDAWELCVNADYDDCRLIAENTPDLNAIGFSRIASSARPSVGGGRGRGRGNEPSLRPRLTLYERVGFAGRTLVIDGDMESLGDFADRAESVRVTSGRWQICDRVRFGGRCVVITGDVRDLDTQGMRGRVASVRFLGTR